MAGHKRKSYSQRRARINAYGRRVIENERPEETKARRAVDRESNRKRYARETPEEAVAQLALLKKRKQSHIIYEEMKKQKETEASLKALKAENEACWQSVKAELLIIKDDMCSECGKSFKTMSSLKRHLLTHKIVPKSYLCLECGDDFDEEISLKQHELTHSPVSNPHEWLEHGQSSKTSQMLKKSLTVCIPGMKHKCSRCGLLFNNRGSLKKHLSGHSPVSNLHECSKCGIKVKTMSSLRRHLLSCKSVPKPYLCLECGDGFEDEISFKQHELIHNLHECSECGKKLTTARSLKRHSLLTHSPVFVLHECSECGNKLKTVASLKRHLLSHKSVSKPYLCLECGVGFCDEISLKQHEVTHVHTCLKHVHSAYMSQRLKKHLTSVAPEKKHRCLGCGISFNNRGCLKRHISAHKNKFNTCLPPKFDHNFVPKLSQIPQDSGIKLNECLECGKYFNGKMSLKQHLLTHRTGLLPYACSECGKGFHGKESLEEHLLTHNTGADQLAYAENENHARKADTVVFSEAAFPCPEDLIMIKAWYSLPQSESEGNPEINRTEYCASHDMDGSDARQTSGDSVSIKREKLKSEALATGNSVTSIMEQDSKHEQLERSGGQLVRDESCCGYNDPNLDICSAKQQNGASGTVNGIDNDSIVNPTLETIPSGIRYKVIDGVKCISIEPVL